MVRHIALRILLQMKLATLPRHAREDRFTGGLEAFMCIADKELNAMQSTVFQARQKPARMPVMLSQSHREPQPLPFARHIYAKGYQHGTIDYLATVTNLLIAGIQNDVREASQRAFTPGYKLLIQHSCRPTDLG